MKHSLLTGILTGIALLLALLALGLLLVFSLRGLYLSGIDDWNLTAYSGLSREEILENYSALMDWCSPFHTSPLSLPSLPMSADGAQHFAECKTLFNGFLLAGAVGLVAAGSVLIYAFRRRERRVFLAAGLTALLLPLILAGACALNFSQAFTLFHQLFFSNNLWLFDPATDPVILILPGAYFLRCALVLCAVAGVGATLCLGTGLLMNRKRREAS